MCRLDSQPISMSIGETYCVECGEKEYYNGNKPLSKSVKCQHCGGRMTDIQREKFIVDWKKTINPILKEMEEIRKKKRTKEDQFVINILEALKNKFDEEEHYPGKYVRLEIDIMIKRMM